MTENKSDYVIRKAKADDCDAIYQMIYDMAVFENMPDQVKISPEKLREDGFGDNPKYRALVCECTKTKKVFGYTIYYFVYSTWKGEIAYLEDIYVEKEWRNKGIGVNLMKSVISDALESGCEQCRLMCLEWNKTALNLYKKYGAKDLTHSENWVFLRFELDEMRSISKINE